MAETNPAIQSYVIEARELLAQLESMLLDLEDDPGVDAVDAVFRALHTLKGGGSMFGFPALSAFVHHFEDAFDLVREGKIGISRALLDVALAGRDHIIALLDIGADAEAMTALAASPQAQALLSDLRAAIQAAPASPEPPVVTWQIRFRPAPQALRHGMRPDLLIAELAGLGPIRLQCDTADLPVLEELDPALGYLGWTITLATTQPLSAIEAVFIFAEDADLDIRPAEVADAPVEDAPQAPPPVAADRAPAPAKVAPSETVRVPAARLDSILDQLGELVIAQARLGQVAGRIGDSTLGGLVEEIQRLVTGLRDNTLAVRMLPIETVFGKFRRVVRDLSSEVGKEVVLRTEGGQTEIDKNVLDRLSEPLVHMIRNAVDHGIEDAASRISQGKPPQGYVQLSACQDAGEILIVIEDDGKGLDLDRIRAKAEERGLIDPSANPTEAELSQMIFAPGFSTAEKVSSISGRGVGMDAVMTAITALRGSVEVMSRPGQGTRVSLRLPLTLAIIDGLLVRLGADTYVIPLVSVEECVEFDSAELRRDSGRSMLRIREQLVPFVDLCRVFDAPPSTESRRRVVIVRSEGERMGFVVDDILGQNQTVIKSMSAFHAGIDDFAGSTILGDGTVALIADVAMLMRRLFQRGPAARAA